MKEARRERSSLYPKVLFGFTDHPITVGAGVILVRVYFEWIKLREELNETLVNFSKRSNNQISSKSRIGGVKRFKTKGVQA